MLPFDQAQANFIDTINRGPDALDDRMFKGPIDRILLGLKAHANTINHARLTALEDSFPLTRLQLGDAQFNKLARSYVETDQAKSCDTNRIGRHFPCHISDPISAELAKIEWAQLEAYHAQEATSVALSALANLDEPSLLAFGISPHPAARLVPLAHPIAAALDELAGQMPAAILVVRPDAEVRLVPLDALEAAVFCAAQKKAATIGNLLACAAEQAAEADPLRPVMTLIGAGALIATG